MTVVILRVMAGARSSGYHRMAMLPERGRKTGTI
jgi:hypothetical protein